MSASERLEILTVALQAYVVKGCGHVVWLDANHVAEIQKSKASFYCSRCGNGNYFPGETEEERLKKLLDIERKRTQWAERKATNAENKRRAEKAAKTRIKNRVAKGVCPCCNRTFENLQRHMTTKHPDYGAEEQK